MASLKALGLDGPLKPKLYPLTINIRPRPDGSYRVTARVTGEPEPVYRMEGFKDHAAALAAVADHAAPALRNWQDRNLAQSGE